LPHNADKFDPRSAGDKLMVLLHRPETFCSNYSFMFYSAHYTALYFHLANIVTATAYPTLVELKLRTPKFKLPLALLVRYDRHFSFLQNVRICVVFTAKKILTLIYARTVARKISTEKKRFYRVIVFPNRLRDNWNILAFRHLAADKLRRHSPRF
jgi:hypothetical protein